MTRASRHESSKLVRPIVPTRLLPDTALVKSRQQSDLLNRKVLMTTNDTLSIATAVRQTLIHIIKAGDIGLPNKP